MSSPGSGQGRIVIVFRNDDPSAVMDLNHENKIFELFDKYQIPQTLGVIPCVSTGDQHSKRAKPTRSLLDSEQSIRFLKDSVTRTGSEIALHGYCHQTNRFSRPSRRDYFEFQRLPLAEQRDLIGKGTAVLESAFGSRPTTFIPPWNRHDGATLFAAKSLGYRVLSAGAYTPVAEGLLGFGTNCSLVDFPRALARAKVSAKRVFIHVLFHSATVRDTQEIMRLESILKTVRSEPECVCMTISEVGNQWPEEIHLFNQAGKNVVPLAAVTDDPRSRLWPYLKSLSVVGASLPFEEPLRIAGDSYWAGDYVGSVEQGMSLERAFKGILLAFRLLITLLSLGATVAVLAILNLRCDWKTSAILSAVTIAVLAAGWAGRRTASALQTGREIFGGAVLALIGMLAGCFGFWMWAA